MVRASDNSFQVKWIESAYERGSLTGTSHWIAVLTILVRPPQSADILRKNPLGLYVDAIDWTRELEVPVRPEKRATPLSVQPQPPPPPAGSTIAADPPLASPLPMSTAPGQPGAQSSPERSVP